jgi:transcriptional regulator with XRE-family HTH domain
MKSFKSLLDTARKRERYWLETAKLGFSVELNRLFNRSGMSQVELATKIGTSPAYITKVFRGDTNFTIETMAKLANVFDGELRIQITPKYAREHWLAKLALDLEEPKIDETTKQWANLNLAKKHNETISSIS